MHPLDLRNAQRAATGLPNRLLLLDRMQQALLASARNRTIIAVLMIDLDRFKTLSKEQRQMLDDMFFNGCSLEEAAGRLKIGITSFKKRWRALKLQLSDEGLTLFN